MESKDFFGAPDPETQWTAPSVLSVVVEACAAQFAESYKTQPDGKFLIPGANGVGYVLSEEEITEDIQHWIRGLQGGGANGDKIVALVRGNPGWERVIAGRVIRRLRERAV